MLLTRGILTASIVCIVNTRLLSRSRASPTNTNRVTLCIRRRLAEYDLWFPETHYEDEVAEVHDPLKHGEMLMLVTIELDYGTCECNHGNRFGKKSQA